MGIRDPHRPTVDSYQSAGPKALNPAMEFHCFYYTFGSFCARSPSHVYIVSPAGIQHGMIGSSHLLIQPFSNPTFIPEVQVEVLNHLEVGNYNTTPAARNI